MSVASKLGIVVIGRNEGLRLHKCLSSCLLQTQSIVYVDSGSTDNSLQIAESLGVHIHLLDTSMPFSAARARNAGAASLFECFSDINFIQFLDGDCELIDGWVQAGIEVFNAEPSVAVVCGQLKERFPEATVYNRLCQIEWDQPCGDIKACGGIFIILKAVFQQVGGFRPDVIAAEDDELCFRVRQKFGLIRKIDVSMAYHDANITRFRQWWTRARRTGHAYAQVSDIHGHGPENYFRKEMLSALVWGAGIPAGVVLLLVLLNSTIPLLLTLAYPVSVFRIARHFKQTGMSTFDAWVYAINCVVAKFAQVQGIAKYFLNKYLKRSSRLIEYK